ncbi:MAG: hypothetical protein P8Y54_14435 [Xanthomonadales bacterium]
MLVDRQLQAGRDIEEPGVAAAVLRGRQPLPYSAVGRTPVNGILDGPRSFIGASGSTAIRAPLRSANSKSTETSPATSSNTNRKVYQPAFSIRAPATVNALSPCTASTSAKKCGPVWI